MVHSAHRAARVARRSLLQRAADDPRLLAEVALRLYVALRDRHVQDIHDLSIAVARLCGFVCAGTGVWDSAALLRTHRAKLEESVCRDMAALGRAKMPERHKASARGQLRRQHAAVRSVRRRISMDALYDESGAALTTASAAG